MKNSVDFNKNELDFFLSPTLDLLQQLQQLGKLQNENYIKNNENLDKRDVVLDPSQKEDSNHQNLGSSERRDDLNEELNKNLENLDKIITDDLNGKNFAEMQVDLKKDDSGKDDEGKIMNQVDQDLSCDQNQNNNEIIENNKEYEHLPNNDLNQVEESLNFEIKLNPNVDLLDQLENFDFNHIDGDDGPTKQVGFTLQGSKVHLDGKDVKKKENKAKFRSLGRNSHNPTLSKIPIKFSRSAKIKNEDK